MTFDVAPGAAAARKSRDPEAPFLLLVMGDFTGRTNRRTMESLAGRRPVRLDCDNAEQVMARLGARLRLPSVRTAGVSMDLRFASIEDFHPDQILRQAGPLAALLDVRRRLQDPASAEVAMVEGQQLLVAPIPPSASGPTPESGKETLARLMGGASAPTVVAGRSGSAGTGLSTLIQQIAAPSVVPGLTPEQSATLAAVEVELATQLRAVLHHPEFQNLEAAWRGSERLVREFGGEENLELYLLDVSKEELSADLKGQENLERAEIFRMLREQGWAALLGDFTFDDTVEDIEMLGRIAKISARLGASFLGGASPHLVGCDSLALHPDPDEWTRSRSSGNREAWATFRALPEASHVGLALPRVLLRQPYGKRSDPVEAFSFEELAGDPSHEGYLWGNGAFVCGYLLADAFRAEGWEWSAGGAGGAGEIDDLPVHQFSQGAERQVKPCAEVWLSERAGERVLSQGLMPLLSIKGRGAVRLMNLQSAAQPSKPLSLRQG